MTPEEEGIVIAATMWVDAPTDVDVRNELRGAVRAYQEACHGGSETLVWVSRPIADVRAGDLIRLQGVEARVVTQQMSDWHVHPASSQYRPVASEHPVQRLRLDYPGSDPTKIMEFADVTTPVEIRVSTYELGVLTAMGWTDRMSCEPKPS